MTMNQNRLKISLRGDNSLQVHHIPLPYFNDFTIPTNSRLIAETRFQGLKIPKFPGVPNRGAAFNRTLFCKNLDLPQ